MSSELTHCCFHGSGPGVQSLHIGAYHSEGRLDVILDLVVLLAHHALNCMVGGSDELLVLRNIINHLLECTRTFACRGFHS